MKKSDIAEFIEGAQKPVTKREIARAFGIKGGEKRVALKQILKKLEAEDRIAKHAGGAYSVPEGLPAAGVAEVADIDLDGDVFMRLLDWNEDIRGPQPKIEFIGKKGHPEPQIGQRFLARFSKLEDGRYEARPIRRLDQEENQVVGLIKRTKHEVLLETADKKDRQDFRVTEKTEAKDGDLVACEIQPVRGQRSKEVRVVKILGRRDDPGAISLISAYETGLRQEFPQEVLKDAEGSSVPPVQGRQDLRTLPLVTIDGADAKDFDDAVYAETTEENGEVTGYHIIVAIADVAYYVRPGAPLDREAYLRGNSTYFPDRVIPMLPEALSNDLCSLRPDEDRACMVAHLWIDLKGNLTKYKFTRGLMRSTARLTYEEVQAAQDGNPCKKTAPLMDSVITPLYAVFRVLEAARRQRGALDLDMPERQILLNEQGQMSGVTQRERLDAHKLIEECMILANVAAANALEDKEAPCVYRVHDAPGMDKIESAREFLKNFDLSLPKSKKIKPGQLNGVLSNASGRPIGGLIHTIILRTQSQAVYAPDNIGHYGLALDKYAHFTSPIRRYADLLVHRSLISAYKLGPGGLSEGEEAALESICQSISSSERTSMEAERNATDRFTAAYLSEHIGASFKGTISGVTRFGLFVTLDESGADGLVPMKTMSDDFYVHDEEAHALVGRRRGKVYRLGAPVEVKLLEADGLTGSTLLELTGQSRGGADLPGMQKPKSAPKGDSKGGPKRKYKGKGGPKKHYGPKGGKGGKPTSRSQAHRKGKK